MHGNQMLQTQYGRHDANYPHMEYVRERNGNNNNSRNNAAASAANKMANNNKNMKSKSKINAGHVKSNNKQPEQRYSLNQQQLQRLKKRTSFTPSQTLAAIERQRQSKQQHLQHQQHQQQQQQQQQSPSKAATAAPISTLAYINNKTDGSLAKQQTKQLKSSHSQLELDAKRRVRRASQSHGPIADSKLPQTSITSKKLQQHQQNQQRQQQQRATKSNLSLSHIEQAGEVPGSNVKNNNGKLPAKYFNKRQKNMQKLKQKQQQQHRQQQKKSEVNEHNIIHHLVPSSRRKREAANDITASVAASAADEGETVAATAMGTTATATTKSSAATAAIRIVSDAEDDAETDASNSSNSGSNSGDIDTILSTLRAIGNEKIINRMMPPNAPQISNKPAAAAQQMAAAISGNNKPVATDAVVAPLANKDDVKTNIDGASLPLSIDREGAKHADNKFNVNSSNADVEDNDEDNDGDGDGDGDEDGDEGDDDDDANEDAAELQTDNDEEYMADEPSDLADYDTVEQQQEQQQQHHVDISSLEHQLDLESLEDDDADTNDDDDIYNVSDDDFVASVALSTAETTTQSQQPPHPHLEPTALAADWQQPHFDYSRMEYSFSNGVVTQSLVGGGANGYDGNSGGGTINFDNYDNIIYSTMELECMPGYDGGLQQKFFLEAYDSKTKKLRLNMSSTYTDVPVFRIDLTGKLHYNNFIIF